MQLSVCPILTCVVNTLSTMQRDTGTLSRVVVIRDVQKIGPQLWISPISGHFWPKIGLGLGWGLKIFKNWGQGWGWGCKIKKDCG